MKDQCFGIEVELTGITREAAANNLRNITNIMASKEDLIYKALEVWGVVLIIEPIQKRQKPYMHLSIIKCTTQ